MVMIDISNQRLSELKKFYELINENDLLNFGSILRESNVINVNFKHQRDIFFTNLFYYCLNNSKFSFLIVLLNYDFKLAFHESAVGNKEEIFVGGSVNDITYHPNKSVYAFCTECQVIICDSFDNIIKEFDVGKFIYDLKFSLDGRFLCICGRDGLFQIYSFVLIDKKTFSETNLNLELKLIYSYASNDCFFKGIVFNNNDVISINTNFSGLYVFDLETFERKSVPASKNWLEEICLSPDYLICLNAEDCELEFISRKDYSELFSLNIDDDCYSICVNNKGSMVALQYEKKFVLIDIFEKKVLTEIVRSNCELGAFISFYDDFHLMIFSEASYESNAETHIPAYLDIFSIYGELIQKIEMSVDYVHSSTFNRDLNTLYVAGGQNLFQRIVQHKLNKFVISPKMYNFGDVFYFEMIEASRKNYHLLKKLLGFGLKFDKSHVIRKLVSDGICISKDLFSSIIEYCWDLLDFNDMNGGNVKKFASLQENKTSDSDSEFDDD
eukprot:TRINITY_DN12372_c0_g1_i1.p1 TRINITY_DN12372_c0_g1~~TRINITY_DN12372_c0_g1_i1.p1  ORF type:complete len:498 (-),score=136.92 TRINITY_DN12372_c0_g1_i1:9-1502(-)